MMAILSSLHPVVLIAAGALLLVDALLIVHAVRRGMTYISARDWPRLEVRADSVDVQRVVHSRQGLPVASQHHEAVYSFRYRVDGREYNKQTVRSVADRAEAEALKEKQTLSFIYNPRNPEQTLDAPPGPAPLILTLAGLLVVNSIGIGLLRNLASFFGGDTP